jgi:cholesterol transport system auxiliary component
MIVRAVTAALVAAVLSACSLPIPKNNEAIVPKIYDLGVARADAAGKPTIDATLAIPAVTGPEWLDEAIVYRLLYDEPSRQHAYTLSRWSADPASLVSDRVRSRFGAAARAVLSPVDNARSDYTLRIELRDFSQSLESPTQGQVTLRARVSLIASAERTLLAQREFETRRAAAANAEGAVKGLTEATDAFLEELVKWTGQQLRPK